ncbi:hypothetical protein CDL15_Pgr003771 [Punica granatum]|uniref:Uncharacterized protein n=1 Tax=Punica granatum TaxID=22663 RepID=A0A218XUT0_PUNGR|nr:hypothetical protein CDL15_Pgr003771 [Punica granatum]PKI41543.1 hypothetical protein CRG98_038054 [Punica granatum]
MAPQCSSLESNPRSRVKAQITRILQSARLSKIEPTAPDTPAANTIAIFFLLLTRHFPIGFPQSPWFPAKSALSKRVKFGGITPSRLLFATENSLSLPAEGSSYGMVPEKRLLDRRRTFRKEQFAIPTGSRPDRRLSERMRTVT